MLLKKYVKSRRKMKFLLLLTVIALIVVTIVILNTNGQQTVRLLDESFIDSILSDVGGGGGGGDSNGDSVPAPAVAAALNMPPPPQIDQHSAIVLEKYDEHNVKTRIIKEKIKYLTQAIKNDEVQDEILQRPKLDTVTNSIHIFYQAPVVWFKKSKTKNHIQKQTIDDNDTVITAAGGGGGAGGVGAATHKTPKILNTAFYPELGLYKPTANLLRKHFENIKNCGIGVLILSLTGKSADNLIANQILEMAPCYNLSVTFEITLASNQSLDYLRQHLQLLKKFSNSEGFYRVTSISRQNTQVPLIYVSNAYKLTDGEKFFCTTSPNNVRTIFDAYYVGHIRLKQHAEAMRRLCFDGFYNKIPSNGATFASTWKNWSYLKTFALTYKMLFVPTVGPGFAERDKFPRHGDVQRHRSNGRYYGVAWRTAIINHVGFISISSYNNWQEGSQIEEVTPKAGFLDYNPGPKTKYIDLTTHWVGNFFKSRKPQSTSQPNCYEYLNNTIC